MGMTVQRRKDTQTPRVFIHKIADVRGGVSVNSAELGSDWLPEGTVVSQPVNGICHAVKVAEVSTAVDESGTVISVKKGSLFNVGDFVLTKVGDKASKITAIDKSGKADDKITILASLGSIELGGFIAEASEASSTTTSALKYEPFAVVGTGKPILPNDNINTDAWVIGVTKGNPLPDYVANKLKGIINY